MIFTKIKIEKQPLRAISNHQNKLCRTGKLTVPFLLYLLVPIFGYSQKFTYAPSPTTFPKPSVEAPFNRDQVLPDSIFQPPVPKRGSNYRWVPPTFAFVFLTGILLRTDDRTYHTIHRWRNENRTVQKLSPVITEMGNGFFSISLFGGFWVYSKISDDPKAFRASKIGLESFLVSGLTIELIKLLTGRERPSAAIRPGGEFHGPFSYFKRSSTQNITYFDSFPSGHTATIFAAAATLSDIYQKPWVSYLSYSTATTVAISRILERTHWLSDIFVGATIGILSTKWVEKFNSNGANLSLEPDFNEYSAGVKFCIKF